MATRNGKNNKGIDDAFDALKTLEVYFDELRKGSERQAKLSKEQNRAAAKAYNQEMEKVLAINEKNRFVLSKRYNEFLQKIREANEKRLAEEEKKERLKIQNSIYADEVKNLGKLGKERRKQAAEEARKNFDENKAWLKKYKELQKEGIELTEEQKEDLRVRKEELKLAGKANFLSGMDKLIGKLDKLTSGIDNAIDKYASYQVGINARLQGATLRNERGDIVSGAQNYFSVLEKNLQSSVGVTGLFRTEDMLNNLQALVESGVAQNVEQRAFLNTLKDDIATTFDAANGTLLRLIRLQQRDSTAMRLGMEAYLTRFLNDLVANTEYLNQTYDNVENALTEAASLMSAESSASFEFVVQKWLGALTGVGLSETAATNLATAIGQLGSGDITNLASTNMFNLISRASSRSNLSLSDMLGSGLTAEKTNELMRSIVDYMVEIGSSSNNVARAQLASTFGVSVSDLVAATNIADRIGELTDEMMNSTEMYDELGYQLGTLNERIPNTVKLSTYFENLQFGLGASIASNPAMAALWKVNNMIEQATGGINIPTVGALGNFVDLNANLNQLMKLGLVGVGSIGMIGDVITGFNSMVDPTRLLSSMNISPSAISTERGSGRGARNRSGVTTSNALYVGSSDSELFQESTLAAENVRARSISAAPTAESAENAIPEIHDYLLNTLEAHMTNIDESLTRLRDRIENGVVSTHDASMDEAVDRLRWFSLV